MCKERAQQCPTQVSESADVSMYKESADILDQLLKRKSGLKSLVYGSHVKNKTKTYALVSETLKFMSGKTCCVCYPCVRAVC